MSNPLRIYSRGTDRAFFNEGGVGIALISELTIVDANATLKPATMNLPDQAIIVETRFILDEGPVTIRWPDKLSAESVHDFEHQVEGIIARVRRKAGIGAKADTKKKDPNP